jgi:serine/threonine protein phosphatase PrpC
MELFTTTVFAPGTRGGAYPDQVLLAPRLGLLAVADAPGAGENGRAGMRIALDTMRAHIERHEDVIERFRRHPTPDLSDRVVEVLEEAFGRAATEVFAYARRREGLRVVVDAVLLIGSEAFVGHLGNGRTYLVRRGLVHLLTVDHDANTQDDGAVFDLVGDDRGRSAQPVRAMGPRPSVFVETMVIGTTTEDRFILCTASTVGALDERVLHHFFVNESLDNLGPVVAASAGDNPVVAAGGQLGSGEPSRPQLGADRLAKLAPMPMFNHCTQDELRIVAAATRPHRHRAGTVIFRQGEPGTAIYLLIDGSVLIERDGNPIVTLGAGSNFGEMAMLDEPSRSASAIAAEDCEVLVIPRDAFFPMLQQNNMLATKILWNMLLGVSARLRDTSRRLANQGG